MKATIRIANEDRNKLAVAAHVQNAKVTGGKKFPQFTLVEVDVKNPADLFEMGANYKAFLGNELEEVTAASPAEQAAPAAKVAGKKS